jgi:hypothetical protein
MDSNIKLDIVRHCLTLPVSSDIESVVLDIVRHCLTLPVSSDIESVVLDIVRHLAFHFDYSASTSFEAYPVLTGV